MLRKPFVLSLLTWLGVANAAQAHAHLLSSVPADVASAPPSALRLNFSEGVEPKLSGVTVTAYDKNGSVVGIASSARIVVATCGRGVS